MKTFITTLILLLTTQLIIGQNQYNYDTETSILLTNNTSQSGTIKPSSSGAPSIYYSLESKADKSYSFVGECSGATEYEWHVQPESYVEKIYYRGSNEILVIFNAPVITAHIVCRAKCNGIWSNYTVGSLNITF